MKAKELPPVERLRELFEYSDGLLIHKLTRSKAVAGQPVGRMMRNGYITTTVDNHRFLVHRIVWKLIHGTEPGQVLDHLNGDRADNCIENLREVTPQQNTFNARSKANKTGFKGVYASGSRFVAMLRIDGKNRYLGTFFTPEEAHHAYCFAAEQQYGEFFNAG